MNKSICKMVELLWLLPRAGPHALTWQVSKCTIPPSERALGARHLDLTTARRGDDVTALCRPPLVRWRGPAAVPCHRVLKDAIRGNRGATPGLAVGAAGAMDRKKNCQEQFPYDFYNRRACTLRRIKSTHTFPCETPRRGMPPPSSPPPVFLTHTSYRSLQLTVRATAACLKPCS